jgi:hypothetical protein
MSCSPRLPALIFFVWLLRATIRSTAEVGNGGVVVLLLVDIVVMHTIERHASLLSTALRSTCITRARAVVVGNKLIHSGTRLGEG